jgi:hypothetical protein
MSGLTVSEYQGVDPHLDVMARQYHQIVKVIIYNYIN